jgi:large subunit ribosomal protein L25
VLDVTVDGGNSHSAVLKDFQVHVIRGTLTHIDLQEVRLDQPIQTAVAVHLVGEPAGVKEGGVLSQVATEVRVAALPLEIPEHLDVDVSGMHVGDTMRLAELGVPDGVTLLDDLDATVVATVTLPTRVEEPELEAAEGEEVAAGEAAAEAEPEAGAEGGEPEPEE